MKFENLFYKISHSKNNFYNYRFYQITLLIKSIISEWMEKIKKNRNLC